MTRLMTSAAKDSPLRMSCGFSSEYVSKSGSTMLTAGSLPASASAKNRSVLRRCRTHAASPSGYRSAVNDLLPTARSATPGSHRPACASRRTAVSPRPPNTRRSSTE